MKLLIVTVVEQFEKDVLHTSTGSAQVFKKASIENFSSSDIDGYRNSSSFLTNSSWFPAEKGGAESGMFFSFTTDEQIDSFFNLAEEFNKNLETNNPIKAVVVPVEKYL